MLLQFSALTCRGAISSRECGRRWKKRLWRPEQNLVVAHQVADAAADRAVGIAPGLLSGQALAATSSHGKDSTSNTDVMRWQSA